MQDLIDEDQAAEDAERGHTAAGIPEEDARKFAQNRAEDESHNSEIIQKMQMRYRMDWERAEHNRDLSWQEEGWTKEPLINVFSGSFIDLNYGEGLLDFIYADFVTPLNKAYRQAYLWEEMLRIAKEKRGTEKHQETAEKILNSTQTQVTDFLTMYKPSVPCRILPMLPCIRPLVPLALMREPLRQQPFGAMEII